MRVPDMKKKWLVFYTRSRAEKACETQLRDNGIEVFLPKCERVRQWKDRKKRVILPLFPNYIFARVDEYERINVLETNGIVQSLFFNGRLVTLNNSDIEQIELMQKQPDALEVVNASTFITGDVVTVKDGPMRGLVGEVIEQYGNTHILVRIDAIHQAVKVKLPVMMVTDCALYN